MDATPPAAGPTPDRHRRKRRIAIAALAVAVVVAGTATALLWPSGSKRAPQAQPTSPAPAPVPTTSSLTPTPTPTPTLPHDYVPQAAPNQFTLSGTGFTITARVCGMPFVRPLDPPGEQHHTVCWVKKDFGVAPSSNSGTTYVLGHAWAPDPREVLNKASSRATGEVLHAKTVKYDGVPIRPAKVLLGAHLTLKTPTGTLTYTVRKSFGVRKARLGDIKSIMNESIRNRVVLMTCAERNGVDYDYNIVLEAFLTSSVRAAGQA